ncbi:MAG: Gfo/Idh/MocA family oxidoreductase [Candidatus Omnitrophica bacterium]|nr:Gfo/Idh/MocA family oxidoreductase [Candidatus Omnitrophota bacterium]
MKEKIRGCIEMPVKLALVGAGRMALESHLPAVMAYMQRCPGQLELTAVVEPNDEKRSMILRKYGWQYGFPTVTEMLKSVQPDASLTLTPYWLNAEVSIELIEAGINVLMEKSCGMNTGEARTLIDAANRTGCVAQVGFNRRHWAALKLAIDWLREGGEPVQYMRGTKHRTRVGRPDEDYVFYTAIHVIDTLLSVGGEPAECVTIRTPIPGVPDCVNNAWNFISTIRFVNGYGATMSALPVVSYNQELYEFHTLASTVIVNQHWGSPEDAEVFEYKKNELYRKVKLPKVENGLYVDGFYDQFETFIKAVAGRGEAYPTVSQCLRTIELSEAVRDGRTWRADDKKQSCD